MGSDKTPAGTLASPGWRAKVGARGQRGAYEMSILRARGRQSGGFARGEDRRHDSPPARMRQVRPPLHHLRTHRRNPLHGRQEGRPAGEVRPAKTAGRPAEGLREAPRAHGQARAARERGGSVRGGIADRERPSTELGELVMNRLKKLDKVAYVRFASVYLDFKDVREFMDELKDLLKAKVK